MRFIFLILSLYASTAHAVDYLTYLQHPSTSSAFIFHDRLDNNTYRMILDFKKEPDYLALQYMQQSLPALACTLNKTHRVNDLDNLRWAIYFKKKGHVSLNITVNQVLSKTFDVAYFCADS